MLKQQSAFCNKLIARALAPVRVRTFGINFGRFSTKRGFEQTTLYHSTVRTGEHLTGDTFNRVILKMASDDGAEPSVLIKSIRPRPNSLERGNSFKRVDASRECLRDQIISSLHHMSSVIYTNIFY